MLRSRGTACRLAPLVAFACFAACGCATSSGFSCRGDVGCDPSELPEDVAEIVHSDIPRELAKVSLPAYRVEPPDILLIETPRNVRPPHAPLTAGDVVFVSLANPEPLEPVDPAASPIETQFRIELEARHKIVDGEFRIQPDGTLDLGPVYGAVRVEGLTVEQAQAALVEHLKSYARDAMGKPVGLKNPLVSITIPDLTGEQPIAGEHLVRPDGTISLGIYGSVYVAGMTLEEVRAAVEMCLSKHIHRPKVNVDVLAYNSKVYYVVTDGGGFGERVVRLPYTGNETVLDAIAEIQGLSEVSSKRIWVARPAPAGMECAQIMDVHWSAITAEGITDTNYQLLPGDRIYIQADHMIALDNFVAKVTAPFERVFGFLLLGNGTVRALQQSSSDFGGGGGGFGGGF